MKYDDEIYNYIKANPGCKTIDIGRYLDEVLEKEHEQKSDLYKWVASLPAFWFFLMPMSNMAKIYFTIEKLEDQGFIRTEKDEEDNRIRCYPTGKHRPYKTSEVSFNPVTA